MLKIIFDLTTHGNQNLRSGIRSELIRSGCPDHLFGSERVIFLKQYFDMAHAQDYIRPDNTWKPELAERYHSQRGTSRQRYSQRPNGSIPHYLFSLADTNSRPQL